MENSTDYSRRIQPQYRDVIFRITISLPVALYMMLYREKENLFDAFTDIYFWIGAIISYLTSLMILWLINRISKALDKKYRWEKETLKRLLLQLFWGICTMVIFTFSLVVAAFWLITGVDITQTEYPSHDFPLVILLIVLGNLYYLTYYLWIELTRSHEDLYTKDNSIKKSLGEMDIYLADTPTGVVIIPQDKIAIIFRQDNYVLLKTFERETYALERSIPHIMKDINPDHFFKINPRCIVSYSICKSYKPGTYEKLDVLLGSPMNSTESVSRTLVNDFERWMRR